MRMENGESFNLMALYTSTRHEREAFRQQQQEERQLQANRMLQAQAMEVEEGNAKHYELRPAIRELARTLDAVVFVVDASAKASASKGLFTPSESRSESEKDQMTIKKDHGINDKHSLPLLAGINGP